jgi:hypothetical protein
MRGIMVADPAIPDDQRAELDRAWQSTFPSMFERCVAEITPAQYQCVMSSSTLDQLARCDEVKP